MKRFISGVDPDLTASGIATWDRQEKKWVDVRCVEIENITDYLRHLKLTPEDTTIYLEAGWKNEKANFRRGFKSIVSETIALHVGENHATSKIIGRLLRKDGWEVIEIAPLGKGKGLLKGLNGWTKIGKDHIRERSGYSGKLTSGEICDAIFIVMAFR